MGAAYRPGLASRDFFARPAREVAPELLGCVLEHTTAEGVVAVELTEVEAYEGLIDPASHSYRGRTPRNAIMWGPPGFAYVYFTYGMYYCVNVVCQPAGTSAAVLIRAGRVLAGEQLARQRRVVRPRPPSLLGRPPAAAAPGALADLGTVPDPEAVPDPCAVPDPGGLAVSGVVPDPGAVPDPRVAVRPLAARELARGPGRLCQALAITLAENGLDCCDRGSPLRLHPAGVSGPSSGGADPAVSPRISAGPRVGVTAAPEVPWRFWLTDEPTVSAYRLHKPRPR
jgi:DNA-3-methyladenine glycosylase